MINLFTRGPSFILFSIYIAFVLEIVPIGDVLSYIRPSWLMLVLIFWIQMFPGRVGLGSVFVTGLLFDVLQDSLLGLHASALLLVAYLHLLLNKQVKVFSSIQQILLIFVYSLIYLLTLRLVEGFFSQETTPGLSFLLPAIVNALIWPWMYLVMEAIAVRLNIHDFNT